MRKHKLPDEIASLTPEQNAELDAWLDRFAYHRVHKMFSERFGVSISISKLHRYFEHLQKSRILSATAPQPITPADLVALRNAAPLPPGLDMHLLQRRTVQLVDKAKSPAELKELLDICTYQERRTIAEARVQLGQRAASHRARVQKFREFREVLAAANTAAQRPNEQQNLRGE